MDIAFSFKTNDKTMSLTVDGKAVANVSEVSVYRSGEAYQCSFMTYEEDKANDCVRMTRLFASESVAAKNAVAAGTGTESTKVPGFVEVPEQSKITRDVAKCFE